MKRLRISLAVVVGLVALCVLGPKPDGGESQPERARQSVPALHELRDWNAQREARLSDLRPDNQAQLFPAEPQGRTALSLVYLHGFSAAPQEIEPVVRRLSGELGANSWSPRLRGHGRTPEALGQARAGEWAEDVEVALRVGEVLGERTVLIGTSTGGTLASLAALEHPELAGLVLISTNLGPADPSANALLLPWLGVLLPRVMPEHCWEPRNEAQAQHWTTCYPIQSVAQMMRVVEDAREADWSRLEVPVLSIRSDDDGVVQQPAIDAWLDTLSVPVQRHVVSATGDESGHVLAGEITAPSKTDWAVETIGSWVQGLQ